MSFARSILLLSLLSSPVYADTATHEIQYKGFKVWLDCSTHSATRWEYRTTKDTDNLPRDDYFYLDPNIPSKCQQTSTRTYKTPKGAVKYDRGHLVPANAMDSDPVSIRQSNIMTNVLPQVAQMNRGAWYQTEVYVECRRNEFDLTVLGGVYRGTMPADGDFLVSHGVTAPEAFWKIAYWGNQLIAWWVPNSEEAVASRIDDYITTVKEIENRVGYSIDVPDYLKEMKPFSTSARTASCKLD